MDQHKKVIMYLSFIFRISDQERPKRLIWKIESKQFKMEDKLLKQISIENITKFFWRFSNLLCIRKNSRFQDDKSVYKIKGQQLQKLFNFPDAHNTLIKRTNTKSEQKQLYKQDLMFSFLRTIGKYSKIKPLKISILSTDYPIKVESQTTNHKWEVKSALENLLSCLVACEVATLKDISRKQNIQIHNIRFSRVQSQYDLTNYAKGGPDNKINDIIIQAQIETNCSQQQLDTLHKKVEHSCPVFQMLTKSGVSIKNYWKNVQL